MYSVQIFFTYIDVTWGSWVQESFHGMAMFGIIFHSPHGRPKEWANLWTTMRRCCTENTAGSITSKKAQFVTGAWRGAGSEDARCFVKREESRHQDTYSLEMIHGVFKLFSIMISEQFWDKWLPNSQLRMRWWQRFAAWRTWGSWVPMLCHRVAWPFPLSVPCWPFDLLDMYGLLVCLLMS